MRRTTVFSTLAMAALALAACTTPKAAQEAPAAQPAHVGSAADNPALLCTSREVTGSRMPVRECHTAAQWAEIKKHGEDALSLEAQHNFPSRGGN